MNEEEQSLIISFLRIWSLFWPAFATWLYLIWDCPKFRASVCNTYLTNILSFCNHRMMGLTFCPPVTTYNGTNILSVITLWWRHADTQIHTLLVFSSYYLPIKQKWKIIITFFSTLSKMNHHWWFSKVRSIHLFGEIERNENSQKNAQRYHSIHINV